MNLHTLQNRLVNLLLQRGCSTSTIKCLGKVHVSAWRNVHSQSFLMTTWTDHQSTVGAHHYPAPLCSEISERTATGRIKVDNTIRMSKTDEETAKNHKMWI